MNYLIYLIASKIPVTKIYNFHFRHILISLFSQMIDENFSYVKKILVKYLIFISLHFNFHIITIYYHIFL